MQILETRCHPPSQGTALIPRDIAADILKDFGDYRIVLVKAPAGYGKTTLLVQLYRSALSVSNSVAWISLDEFEGCWTETARYLIHALAVHCAISTDFELKGCLIDDAVTELRVALQALPGPVFIFLDDFHVVRGASAEQFVSRLMKHTMDIVQWVIGTRAYPSFGLARWRAAGRLIEISAEELRFSSDEASRMLVLSSGEKIPDRLVEIAHARTEGWPVGLKLVSIALSRSTDEEALIERLSGRNRDVSTFFYEEVFDRLDANLQSFLLQTSVLERFCPELCDAVTRRTDGRRMIQELESTGLFIFSLDDVQLWYRYHHLFADFLLRLLRERESGLERTLHDRASDWFHRSGLIAESIQHAFRGDNPHRAAMLLDVSWEQLNEQGVLSAAVRWAESLPASVLDDFPGIQLWRAWYLMCERRFDESRLLLRAVAAKLEVLAPSNTDRPQVQAWRHSLLHRELMLAQYSDDVLGAEQLYRALLKESDAFDPFVRTTIEIAAIYTQREQYSLREIESIYARAAALGSRSGKESVLVWLACAAGPAFVLQGKTDAAVDLYRGASELVNRIKYDSRDFRATPMLLLADLLVERGELTEARNLFQQAGRMGTGVGFVDHLISFYVTQARMAHFDGDVSMAQTLLREGFALAVAKGLDRLRWSVVQERIRQSLARIDVGDANQIAIDAALPALADSLRPRGRVTTQLAVMAMAWIQLAIANGRYSDAIFLARQWVSFAKSRDAVATQVRFLLLLTRAIHAVGDDRAALRTMRESMSVAAGPQFIFGFIEAGDSLQSLARKAVEAENAGDGLTEHASQLASMFSVVAWAGSDRERHNSTDAHETGKTAFPIEPLSPREVEVLRYVSRSLLNKEIADRLGMTEGTVKWHMQQIFGKLGVRRRVAALDKARSFGYLP